MAFWNTIKTDFGKVEKVGVDVGKVILPVVEAGGPIAASTFLGPVGGQIVTAVISEINGLVSKGQTPNVNLLKTSIGMLVEGTIGVLQATGKIPAEVEKYLPLAEDVVKGVTGVALPTTTTMTITTSTPKLPVSLPTLPAKSQNIG